MRAIQCCVFLALLMTASAVPASSKGGRPDDPVKGKKTTSIASVKNTTATTVALRPIVVNATLPYTIRNTTSHSSSLSSSHSSSPSSIATTAAITSATTMLKLPAISPTTSIATSTTTTSSSISSTASLLAVSGSLDPQNAASSPAFTETSPRIISPTPQHTAATVLSLRKSAVSVVADVTTTVPLTSAKETRESPGKIRPQIKLTTNYTSETGVRLPEGASAALAKPTKYHYYPHNQHIYLLPECAVQQVCNAVYVRLNFTQPLCACPGRYRDPCSASLDSDDLHTTELVTDPRTKALTLVKTCEPVAEMRECRASRDWSLLALQNVRTGKSHYLVICRCPDTNILEGPMSHDQPTYASVPGIRVYGMMCVQGNRRGRPLRYSRSLSNHVQDEEKPRFPWHKVRQLMATSSLWE
ncbi:mucin-5AC [Camponotus floridanus]|nr:mucin-5AC [Camponotus floridanus]